jgi:hypothetical protein
MWTMVLSFIKKPAILAIIVLVIMCGTLYVNNKIQDAKIEKLKASITLMENNFHTCKTNEKDLLGAIEVCNNQSEKWVESNNIIRGQLENANKQIKHWQDLYDNKVCYNNDDETPVVPSQQKVVNDEKSIDAINRLNLIFGN